MDVSYFRRLYGNSRHQEPAAAPSDFSPFSVAAPVDARLPLAVVTWSMGA
jgi:hypothetical protein